MRLRHALAAVALAGILLAGSQAALVLTAEPLAPARIEPLLPDAASAPTDEQLALAREFAPWFHQETDEVFGRFDIPVAMDFDGDRDATNDWENLARHVALPTAYYTVVETQTHWFLAYHLYYPRDWSRLDLGLHNAHEGDGVNVQVVVEKANRTVVLVTTQDESGASSYAMVGGPVRSGEETLRADFGTRGTHPLVWVGKASHRAYGSYDLRATNRAWRQHDPIVPYGPTEPGDPLVEPPAPYGASACLAQPNKTVDDCGGGDRVYRLVSLPAFLGNATRHDGLFAGPRGLHDAPLRHEGDRYSGPLGRERGVSPFALGYDDGGALFWDPAARYQELFVIEGAWAPDVVTHPFRP